MTGLPGRVFVVDDDDSVRKAFARLLRSAGFVVETFPTADSFLKHEPADAPACLVLDVCLPDLSGSDLQRALSELESAPPIVFVTGHGDIPMTVQAIKAGAIDFLAKPVDEAQLLAAVRRGIAKDDENRRERARLKDLKSSYEALSVREREVMALVVSEN